VDNKQWHLLPGLDDPDWAPLGRNVKMARSLAFKGVRIMRRERADHRELAPLDPLDPGLPPKALYVGGQSSYFYYAWGPDIINPAQWLQEKEQLHRNPGQQKEDEEVVARPRPRKPGPKPTADWKSHVAYYVGCIKGSGEEMPTAAKIAEWCEAKLDYHPDISDINKLLKTLRD
jgi:hypothetical protein